MLTLLRNESIIDAEWMTDAQRRANKDGTGIDFVIDYIAKLDKQMTIPRVLVLDSGTGTGKSTLIPPNIYSKLGTSNVIIAEPTVMTTESIPKSIVQYTPYMQLGTNIGFQTGDSRRIFTNTSGVLFCTYGILLQKLSNDDVSKYKYIIIDEAHNRSTELDRVMMYLRRLITSPNAAMAPFVIFMSGTLDMRRIQQYFSLHDKNFLSVVKQSSFNIDDSFANERVKNLLRYTNSLISNVDTKGDVLVFVDGEGMMTAIKQYIALHNEKAVRMGQYDKILFLFLINRKERLLGGDFETTFVAPADKLKVVVGKQSFTPSRKVYVATNAIETGMTIDNLSLCIDTGLINEVTNNPYLSSRISLVKNVSKKSAIQRRGRVGRTAPGQFFAAYTQNTFETLPETTNADVVTNDTTMFMLDTMRLCGGDISKLTDLYQVPPSRAVVYSLSCAYWLGFLNDSLNITPRGEVALRCSRFDVHDIAMVLNAHAVGAPMADLVTIAAFNTAATGGDFPFAQVGQNLFFDFLYCWKECNASMENTGRIDEKVLTKYKTTSRAMTTVSMHRARLLSDLKRAGVNVFAYAPLDKNYLSSMSSMEFVPDLLSMAHCIALAHYDRVSIVDADAKNMTHVRSGMKMAAPPNTVAGQCVVSSSAMIRYSERGNVSIKYGTGYCALPMNTIYLTMTP